MLSFTLFVTCSAVGDACIREVRAVVRRMAQCSGVCPLSWHEVFRAKFASRPFHRPSAMHASASAANSKRIRPQRATADDTTHGHSRIPSVSTVSVIAVAISICSSSICTRDALSGPLLAQHQRADHCLPLPCYPRRLMRRRSATTCIKSNPAAPCACGRTSPRVGGRDRRGRLHDRLRRCCRRRQCHWCPHFRRRNAAAAATIASICIWCRSWRCYLVGGRRLQGRWRLADRRRSRLRAAHVGHLPRCTTDQRNAMDGKGRK